MFSFTVLNRPEEVILPDCQDMSHPDQSPDHPTTGRRCQSHACLQEGRTRDWSGETLPEPRAQPRVQWRSVLFFFSLMNILPPTFYHDGQLFNAATRIASRPDSSSKPPDPCGRKQPCPVPGGHHHWKTERTSSLWTSTGELSVIEQRGQLNAPSATPHHFRPHWQIEQWQSPDTQQLLSPEAPQSEPSTGPPRTHMGYVGHVASYDM